MDQKTKKRMEALYQKHKSVYMVAEEMGVSKSFVHTSLRGMGVTMNGNGNAWTEADTTILLDEYQKHRCVHSLQALADKMGRTKHFICRKAKELGLTDRERTYSSGKKSKHADGYIHIGHKGHEHVLIMEEYLGRAMEQDEVVHHCDEVRHHNDISNLELMLRGEHFRFHNSGEKSHSAKMDWKKVSIAREMFGRGILRADIARKFNISWTTADSIVKNRTWITELN